FFASRSVPSPYTNPGRTDGLIITKKSSHIRKIDVRLERWERIARESIKQCGRSLLPLIHQPMSFDQMISESASYGEKITFWEKSTTSIDELREIQKAKEESSSQNQDRVIVMIGPEGGFSEQEIELARHKGFKDFSLGNRILRAETASVAACTLIQNIFGDIGKKR
ncbi:MAG: RNA methyltransferase, partial [Desulfamplus sp.]|nr:RNA methyltransferase [Desulfamplus sp.]